MSLVENRPSYRPIEEVKLDFADNWEPGDEPGIGVEASFGIYDPRIPQITKNCFCIGFTYTGGPLGNPKSWRASGTLYWPDDDYEQDCFTVPVRVSNRALDRILEPKGTSVKHLLVQFLKNNTEIQ